MDPRTLGDLLEHRAERDEDGDRSDSRDALYAPGDPERSYDAARLLTDARKTGNFLRQLGVGPGRTVAIADVPVPESVLALFGAALLDATARFVSVNSSDREAAEGIDARVLVGPTDALDALDALDDRPVNATKRVAYGARPDDPEVAFFERDFWSENPTFPPSEADGADRVLETGGRADTHGDLLTATKRVVEREDLDRDIEVAIRAPLTDPRTVVAGVIAPLTCGGSILFPNAGARGDVAVVAIDVGKGVPEPRSIDVAAVPLDDQ